MLLMDKEVGRRGASAVKMSHGAYILMSEVIKDAAKKGRLDKLGFSQEQTNRQYRTYLEELRKNSMRGKGVSTEDLMMIAKLSLAAQSRKYAGNTKGAPMPNSGMTPAQQRASVYLQQVGLKVDAKDIPDHMQGALGVQTGIKPLNLLSPAETALELIEVAEMMNPTMAVAMVLLAKQLENAPSVRQKATQILAKKCAADPGNPYAKEICILGLENTIEGEEDRQIAAQHLQSVIAQEPNEEMRQRMLNLQKPPAPEPDKRSAFLENGADYTALAKGHDGGVDMGFAMGLVDTHVAHFNAAQQHPNYINPFLIPSAPKPPSWATEDKKKQA